LQCPAKRCRRFIVLELFCQCDTKVIVGIREVGPKANGFSITCDGLIELL